jgi:beta-lactamase class A|tara:strand:- start:1955 stop:2818 length:864 start_codon:yes stop_codon:yes gene_type:complete
MVIMAMGCSKTPAERHEIGVAYLNLDSGNTFFHSEKLVFHAASTMKTPVMFQLYLMRDAGLLSLKDSLTVINEFKSIVDGSPYSIELIEEEEKSLMGNINKKMAIQHLIEAMITTSSNLATNILIELADPKAVMATLKEIGADGVSVIRGVEDLKAFDQGLSNRTDAYGMMMAMKAVFDSELVRASSRQEMVGILKNQEYNQMIPTGLPPGTPVAHKTGWITGITHDAAIVMPKDDSPFVLVILTRGWMDFTSATQVGVEITKAIFQYHKGKVLTEKLRKLITELEN